VAMNAPKSWSSRLLKAAWTVALAAVLVLIAAQVLKQLIGPLLIVGVLVVLYRLALGQFRKGQW
jgi:hypothetical protein